MTAHGVAAPHVRLVVGSAWVTAVALLPEGNPLTPILALGAGVAAAMLLRPPLRPLLLRSAGVAAFVAVAFAPVLLGPDPGRAVALGARAVGAALVGLSLAGSFRHRELSQALGQLGAPRFAIEVIDTALAQLRVVVPVGQRLALARQLRGASRGRAVLGAVPELLVRSAERAERLELARELRGPAHARARTTAPRRSLLLAGGLLTAVAFQIGVRAF